MKCRLSILRRSRTKKPWLKITIKPWSKFSPMAIDVVYSNMAFAVTDQGFRMAYLNLPTRFLWSSLRIWGAPSLSTRRGQGCGGSPCGSGKRPGRGHRRRGDGLTVSLILVLGCFLEIFIRCAALPPGYIPSLVTLGAF